MKKLLIRLVIAVVLLVILVVVAMSLFVDGAVKRGIETIGPMPTKVEVKTGVRELVYPFRVRQA